MGNIERRVEALENVLGQDGEPSAPRDPHLFAYDARGMGCLRSRPRQLRAR